MGFKEEIFINGKGWLHLQQLALLVLLLALDDGLASQRKLVLPHSARRSIPHRLSYCRFVTTQLRRMSTITNT